jgi:hypothetical protein
MQLVIEAGGRVRSIYGEEVDLATLGPARISRASHLEPNEKGLWIADLSPVGVRFSDPSGGEAMPWNRRCIGWRRTC